MSAAKRRIKRKIAQLVRMCEQVQRYRYGMDMGTRSVVWANAIALSRRIADMGYAERAKEFTTPLFPRKPS